MRVAKIAGFRFLCDSDTEVWRAHTLLTKEEGTVKWIQDLDTNGIFYDIGANIGCYTMLAANRVSKVYAFEPHLLNAFNLMRNITENKLNNVRVLTCALAEKDGLIDFNYLSSEPGSSGSQLGHVTAENGNIFSPILTELKQAVTIDTLWNNGLEPASAIKIDVDGNELAILKGMPKLLSTGLARSIQVEVHPKDSREIHDYMSSYRYNPGATHYTSAGKKAIAEGADPKNITANIIFYHA